MFDNINEFENYENKIDPVMYVVNVTDKYDQDIKLNISCDQAPDYQYPFKGKSNSEIRSFISKVKEFQIRYDQIRI